MTWVSDGSVTNGLCLITDGGSCATSPNFPNDYPNLKGCTLYGLPQAGLDVIAFDVEVPNGANCIWDYLVVDGVRYCGTSGPAGVVPSDGTMTWVSDGSVTESGWKARSPFSLAPCTLPILSSRAQPALNCTIYNVPPVELDVIAFDVEFDVEGCEYYGCESGANCLWDYLIVNGVKYCGTSGPAGVVPSNGTMTWVSDGE
ncbi:hypothetical protein EMIHUDRAFT_257383, partial [Emiliania huxleyi CCMP1516]|uniref:CUB domain-containing protein n=2 Tax=Emiliania huxleyi TaxID=2903 RepID=A0A0D3IJS8_EMIH1